MAAVVTKKLSGRMADAYLKALMRTLRAKPQRITDMATAPKTPNPKAPRTGTPKSNEPLRPPAPKKAAAPKKAPAPKKTPKVQKK